MTQKRQCHARESGHPDLAARAGALDSRFRGNDTTLRNLILNDALSDAGASLWRSESTRNDKRADHDGRRHAGHEFHVGRRLFKGDAHEDPLSQTDPLEIW